MNLFGQFFSNLFGNHNESVPEPEDSLNLELERAWDKVQALAQKTVESKAPEVGNYKRSQDELARQHEDAQSELWKAVRALHSELNTGLDQTALLRLRKMALGHAFEPEEPPDLNLEERIEYFALRHVFKHCGERAWQRLEDLMEAASEGWPVPPDLSYHRDSESVANMVVRRQQDLKQEFVAAPLKKQADLVIGEVSVWGPTYPASDSWLWQETALV